jgi:hypothetical protein
MFNKAIGEPYMDPLAIFKSPIRIASYEWDTSMVAGSQFLKYELPAAFAANPTFHKLMLQTYVYYKPDIVITLQINATPQHMGLLRLWYDPFTQFMDAVGVPPVYSGRPPPKYPTIYTTSGQPHTDIQACDSSPSDLHIRFEHPQSCLTTNSVDPIGNMGRVGVIIVNPLEAPATSSSVVTVQMWMRFKQVELGVPIWDHNPQIPSLVGLQQSDTAINMDAIENDIPVMPNKNDFGPGDSYGPPPQSAPPRSKDDRAWWEKGLGFLAGVGGTAYNVVTGNWGGAVRSGIGAISDFASMFMDKPSDPNRAVHNMIFPIPPLAHTQGIGGHVRLDAAPIGGYTQIDFTSSDPLEQKLAKLMKIPMMVTTFDWSSTNAPGDLLYRIPVTPTVCKYDTVVGPAAYSNGAGGLTANYRLRTPTYLSKYSSLFKFWSGSIKFGFQFVTTSIHTGKVLTTFIPNNYADQDLQTLVQQTCASSVEFDVAGQKNFEFTPGWVSSIPRKTVYDWSAVDYSLADDRTILGWLEVRVTGRLTTTNAIPGTVHCNVWMSAGDDFFCETLVKDPYIFPAGWAVTTNTPPPTLRGEQQSGDENPTYAIDQQSSKINNMSSVRPCQMTNTAVGDVRDPCRRANYLGTYRIPLVKGSVADADPMFRGSIGFLCNPNYTGLKAIGSTNPLDVLQTPNPAQDLLASLSDGFVFYSGSLDWTFIPYTAMNNNIHMKAYFYPLESDDINRNSDVLLDTSSYGSLPAHMTVLNQQRALQVTTPYTSNYNQLATVKPEVSSYAEEVFTTGILRIDFSTVDVLDLPTGDGDVPMLYMEAYRAAGDDFRFSWATAPGDEWTLVSVIPPP